MPTPARAPAFLMGFVAGTLTATAVAAGAPPDLGRALEGARIDLGSVQLLTRQVREPELRYALSSRIARIDGLLAVAQEALYRPPPPRPPPGLVGEGEFGALLRALEDERFSDDRRAMLGDVFRGRRLTTAQVVRVLGLFPFDDDKVDVAAGLYPSVVDPQSWWAVYGALTFSASKEDLRRRVGAR